MGWSLSEIYLPGKNTRRVQDNMVADVLSQITTCLSSGGHTIWSWME